MKDKIYSIYQKLSNGYTSPDFLSANYIPSLDGWRAIGVTIVILGHAKLSKSVSPFIHNILDKLIYAELGVQIFFVLSGFLITIILIKTQIKYKAVSLKNFYIKRALRILPVFYLYLFVLFVLNLVLKLNLSWQHFAGPLLFINNFNFFDATWLTGHTWSLAVEEQFYLLWPIIFILLPKKSWLFCFFIILSKVFLYVFWYVKPSFYVIMLGPFFSHADALLTGCLVAILCFKGFFNKGQQIWHKWYLPLIAALTILFIYHYSNSGLLGTVTVPFGPLIVNTLIVFLIVQTIIHQKSFLFRFLNYGVVKKIGVLSYSLYIWQQLFLVPQDYNNAIFWNVFPYNILLAFLVAYLSYNYFESYFLKIKDNLKKENAKVTNFENKI